MDIAQIKKLAKQGYRDETLTRPDWTKDAPRDESCLWLDKNENIDPELNETLRAILAEIQPQALNTYPDAAKVYKKIAKTTGLDPANFLLTNGSDGAIRAMFDVFMGPGDKLLHSNPTFAMYFVYAKMFGTQEILCDYEDTPRGPHFPKEKFLGLVRQEKPKLICLPNPDSPSGTVLDGPALRELIQVAREYGSLLLIDEAYFPFYEETVLPLVNDNPHLFVARSFSKAWGAAGVRVGFLAGHPELMGLLHKNRPMYELGTLATEVIYHLLDHQGEVRASISRLLEGKEFFLTELNRLGFTTAQTHGNFLHVRFGPHQERIAIALKSTVLFRSNFQNTPGMKDFSRFSLGTREQFQQILAKIQGVMP